MQIRLAAVFGLLLIVAGSALWLFARDAEFFWFRGGPLGVVLVVVGAIDVVSARRTGSSGR
ncbi:hypothetical protein [Prescottella agglutinans]|uniref:Uncharacterized membrane protein YbhN (UPF0104 family) n=1 Tax=Prescottella agglutinans TaxID=1644129 RepID=A0ABT6M9R2_9NOCA|nr:hypothetical protein [Prescottella agglutinans]MDH6280625.1 uncharacterized membrane protein YbhN (UPF0104 family) [Prescottella agglutinans]